MEIALFDYSATFTVNNVFVHNYYCKHNYNFVEVKLLTLLRVEIEMCLYN